MAWPGIGQVLSVKIPNAMRAHALEYVWRTRSGAGRCRGVQKLISSPYSTGSCMHDARAQQPGRRWLVPRLSIRALMIVILILGAGLGYLVVRAHDQRDTVAAIQHAGGTVVYDWQWKDGNPAPFRKPRWPDWLIKRLGTDFFHRVKQVVLAGAKGRVDDNLMARVGRLRDLEKLSLNNCKGVTDAGLAHLNGLTGLRELDLTFTGVTGAGLKKMTRLNSLGLGNTGVTDLTPIRHLTGLTSLSLGSTPIDDAALAPVAGLTR